jgi:diguanylate cyclase (GGDEF)-like protein
LAVAQYSAVVAVASARIPAADPAWTTRYGADGASIPAMRVALLGTATLLSVSIVARMEDLRRLSAADRLTGLLNRGGFDERLNEETSRASRHGHPLTLALIDIDRFKRFNDTHGHPGGDALLESVADTLRSAVRKSDVVARYGGEEFALILPETRAADALPRLEALRVRVAADTAVDGDGVTISVGVAGWPGDCGDLGSVLAEADRRLYEAKRGGRDRVVGPPAHELAARGRP